MLLVGCTATPPPAAQSDPALVADALAEVGRMSTPQVCTVLSDYTGRMREIAVVELTVRGSTLCDTRAAMQGLRYQPGLYARRDVALDHADEPDWDCADFPSAAHAQQFFLSTGGPVADQHGLDRDGDGAACEWGAGTHATPQPRTPPPLTSARRCYTGPRGGTYTLTSSGNRNYSGC